MNQYKLVVASLETELEQFDLCCPENFRCACKYRSLAWPWFTWSSVHWVSHADVPARSHDSVANPAVLSFLLFAGAAREHYNPFVPWFKLLGCFFSAILSALWILHIILYMLFTVRGGRADR